MDNPQTYPHVDKLKHNIWLIFIFLILYLCWKHSTYPLCIKPCERTFPYCQKCCKINVSQCFTNCISQTYPQVSATLVDKFFREHSLFPVHNNYSKFSRAFLMKCRARYPQSNSRDLLPSLGCLRLELLVRFNCLN